MAGQLTIDTLKASSGVLATQNGMTGIAKAWVNFNGTSSPVIRTSFNVSSVTKLAAGYFQVTYTTAMPNANYAVAATAGCQSPYSNDGSALACVSSGGGTPTTLTTGVQIITTLAMNSPGHDAASFLTSVVVYA